MIGGCRELSLPLVPYKNNWSLAFCANKRIFFCMECIYLLLGTYCNRVGAIARLVQNCGVVGVCHRCARVVLKTCTLYNSMHVGNIQGTVHNSMLPGNKERGVADNL